MGATISKAGAERATPLATATLVVAANAPDVDVLSYAGGGMFALATRRGITHGWPALVVLPFVVAACMLAWDRWVRLRRNPEAEPARPARVLALAVLGLLTHPTLDWMNTYGMRWALPFEGSWSYGDALFIIDPWIWLALGGAVFLTGRWSRRAVGWWAFLAVAASGLVTVGVGWVIAAIWVGGVAAIVLVARSRRGRGPLGAPVAQAAVASVAVYIAVLVTADGLASSEVRRAAEADGIEVLDVMVAPMPGTPTRAAVEVVTPDALVPGTHRWFGTPRATLFPAAAVSRVDRGGVSPDRAESILAAARRNRPVADYLVWSRYPLYTIRPAGDGWTVRVSDGRYDDRAEVGGLSGLTVTVTPAELTER